MTAAPRLLIIEDDLDAAEMLREMLTDHFGKDCCTAVDHVAEALELDLNGFDLVLSDMNLPDGYGLELLKEMLARREDLPVVMVTSESGLDVAMESIRRGAYDYVVKAGDYLFTIPLVVEKNLEVWRIKQDNTHLQHQLQQTLEQIKVKNEQLEQAVAKLEELASTDPLTGLANRRTIGETLDRAFAAARRYQNDLTCIMIDLDLFKPINDTLWHQTGDQLLKTAARILTANSRRSDVVGRYGGDEFVLIMPQTDPITAVTVAERVQRDFQAAAAALLPEDMKTSMSLGIACVSVNHPVNADQLVALADAALYRAKQQGKGRIAQGDPPPQHPTAPATSPSASPQ